jgi:hypothetical protein
MEQLLREMDEWAQEMHRDLRAIIEDIAANNQRIEQLRVDLHLDMTAGFDRILEQFSGLQRELAELGDEGAAR